LNLNANLDQLYLKTSPYCTKAIPSQCLLQTVVVALPGNNNMTASQSQVDIHWFVVRVLCPFLRNTILVVTTNSKLILDMHNLVRRAFIIKPRDTKTQMDKSMKAPVVNSRVADLQSQVSAPSKPIIITTLRRKRAALVARM
jgi:hypothetical protein